MPKFDPIASLANMRHEFGEHGGVNMSIEASTTFTVMHAETMPEIFGGRLGPDQGGCFLYGRHFNPTVYVLGRELAALEGAEAGYATSSGMSAVAGAIMQCCDHGDHVVAANTLYGGTFALLKEFLPAKSNISVSMVDIDDHGAVEGAFTDRTRVLYCETMANPTLIVADIPKLAEIAHRHDAVLVVDNTFCPLVVSPIQLGADIVVHSMTKFINGASDIIAGAICGTGEFITSLMDLHTGALMLLGPTMDPQTAFNISLRIPHLGIRMQEHSRRALAFAQRLAEHGIPATYPGLPEHPQHELLKRIGNTEEFGFGGLLGLDLGTTERAYRLMETLQNQDRFGYMAVSLGYFDTLMSCSGSSTSSELPEADQQAAGISPGYVRMSVGYTGALEQRWQQLEDALRQVGMIG
jgi:methionine-gamma-lyase